MRIKIIFWIFAIILFSSSVYSLNSAIEHTGVEIMHKGGIGGSGNTICLIDGGLYYQHSNLGGCVGSSCKVLATYNAQDGSSNIDSDEHGTWTAGVIISDHSKYKGVAFDSKLVFVQNTNFDNWSNAIEWCVNNKEIYNISVISMSQSRHVNQSYTNCLCQNIGCGGTPYIYDEYNILPQVQNALNKNITVVFSAGNQYEGYDVWPDGTPITESANYPACLPGVIAIGSVDDNDDISDFSNRKKFVEIMAPGEDIITTHTDGDFSYMTESKIKRFLCNFGFANCGVSGTSFSTPYMAGVVALIKEYDTAIVKPSFIEKLLNNSGKRIYDINSDKWYSRVDLNELFHLKDWPTFHHDNRRTGFTLLKGDTSSASDVKKYNIVLHGDVTTDIVSRISVADVDDDEKMDVIVGASKSSTDGWLYRVESNNAKWLPNVKKRWTVEIGQPILAPPSLGDTYGDEDKEIFFGGDKNGF